jgi:TetR/AcrR family transcriptional regulator, regulator of cefoperazone and chloramphenicol sensitivity
MSASTKERIFEVAGPVFAEKGFQATTVRELCVKATVNVASINYYFGDKKNLYSELVRHAQQRCEAQHPLPTWEAETPHDQRLYELIRTFLLQLSVAETASWEVQLLMREVLYPSNGGAQVADEYFSPFFKTLLEIIEGLSPVELSYDRLAGYGISVLSQCLIYRYGFQTLQQIAPAALGDGEHIDVDRLARQIVDFSLAAICGGPQRGETPKSEKNANGTVKSLQYSSN